jgi:recombination protein RecA
MGFIDKIYKEIGESDFNQDVRDWLSTGLLPLNKALSGDYHKGIPVGRITEIIGGPSTGKTLLATMALIETQRRDGIGVLLDYEHAFSLSRAKKLGLSDDRNKWIYKQPPTAEEGFRIVEFIANAVRNENPDKFVTIVKDSVASMITQEEAKVGYGEGNMRTRLSLPVVMSESLKKIAGIVSKTNITLIYLNQTRVNPGVVYGDSETTPGGNALKFYASVRLRLSKGGKIKGDDEKTVIGENVKAGTIKNKVYEPFRDCEYITHFTDGINLELSHINFLDKQGKFGDSKGWLELDGKKYRRDQLLDLAKSDPAINAKILSMFS